MQLSYLNSLVKILSSIKEKKTLLLIDEYYTETPFKKNSECIDIKKFLNENFSKDIKIVKGSEDFKDVKDDNFELIINIHYSTKYSSQVDFINQVLKKIKLDGFFLNILPFVGFVNYNCQTYNPSIFNKLNLNKNFLFKYFSLVDNYGNQIVIENTFLNQFFLQTTEKKNQNHLDEVYRKIVVTMKDVSILCLSKINKFFSGKYDPKQ